MTSLRFPQLAFALVLSAGLGAAHAVMLEQGEAAASQPGKDYATRDQLRSCMQAEDALKAKNASLDAAQAMYRAHVDAIDTEKMKIANLQARPGSTRRATPRSERSTRSSRSTTRA